MTKARWAQLFLYSFTILVGLMWARLADMPPPVVVTITSATPKIVSPSYTNEGTSSVPKELILVGRLMDIDDSPGCGFVHFGVIAEYSVHLVLSGTYTNDTVYVIHGCPELTRREYARGSGSLEEFHMGDYHQLHLTTNNEYRIEHLGFYDVTFPKGLPEGDNYSLAEAVNFQDGLMYFCRQVDLYQE